MRKTITIIESVHIHFCMMIRSRNGMSYTSSNLEFIKHRWCGCSCNNPENPLIHSKSSSSGTYSKDCVRGYVCKINFSKLYIQKARCLNEVFERCLFWRTGIQVPSYFFEKMSRRCFQKTSNENNEKDLSKLHKVNDDENKDTAYYRTTLFQNLCS